MTPSSTYRFFRPTVFVVLCYCAAMAASYLLSTKQSPELESDFLAVQDLTSSVASLVDPDPKFGPREVVQIQLDGLANDDAVTGILQCMHFASPDNRAVTGPLERFGRMVRNEKFVALAEPDRVLIGDPTWMNGVARVLVTLIHGKQLRSYVWVLAKQTKAPYQGCWMTEAVFPLHSDASEDSKEI